MSVELIKAEIEIFDRQEEAASAQGFSANTHLIRYRALLELALADAELAEMYRYGSADSPGAEDEESKLADALVAARAHLAAVLEGKS